MCVGKAENIINGQSFSQQKEVPADICHSICSMHVVPCMSRAHHELGNILLLFGTEYLLCNVPVQPIAIMVQLLMLASTSRYKCVIILCDSQWCDPDMDSSNGIQMGLRDMLRIDSMLMMVQLNIRVLLEVCSLRTTESNHQKCAPFSAAFQGTFEANTWQSRHHLYHVYLVGAQ